MLNLPEFIADYPQKFKQFKVNDLLFVEYHCIIEEMKAGYWTPSNYFLYILKGKKSWESQGKVYTGKANDALFVQKGAYVVHQFFEEEFCTLLIFVPDDFIKKVIQKHQINCGQKTPAPSVESIIPLQVNEVLSTYFKSVLSYFPKAGAPPRQLLQVKFEELIITMLSDPDNRKLGSHFHNICSRDKISIREIMESNFTHNMNLEEFAKLSGRSLSTFHRDFKEIYHTTPGKWLTKQRAEYSKYMLEIDGKTVSDVAFESGFESSSHFIRVFKENFGVTPLEFKKQQTQPA